MGGRGKVTRSEEPGKGTLTGGRGRGGLLGGSGADTVVWKAGDTGSDGSKDFNASEGDRIDLRELLKGGSRQCPPVARWRQ